MKAINNTTQELSKAQIISRKHREYYQKNKEERKQAAREHYFKKREIYLERTKQKRKTFNANDKQKLKEYAKLYYVQNKQKISEKGKSYRKVNSSIIKERHRIYKEKNKDIIKIRSKESWRRKYYNNPIFRLECKLRTRIAESIKNNKTATSRRYRAKLETFLGCTLEEAKAHIEKQWSPGMSWVNYTHKGWHIDHIKPVNTFDFTDIEQQKKCFHYTNLRPLWATDNLSRPKDGRDVLAIN